MGSYNAVLLEELDFELESLEEVEFDSHLDKALTAGENLMETPSDDALFAEVVLEG